MPRPKLTAEKKIEIIEAYQSGEISKSQIKEVYGINPDTIYKWIPRYEAHGVAALAHGKGNASYSREFKTRCVKAYLRGEGSLNEIVGKYNISSQCVLSDWIQRYNANQELKDYDPKREVYMANARRKTTLEERKEIVKYCIAHDKDYKGTAAFYDVSYSQVYSWVKKYLADGEGSLEDKRGRHKTDDEVDELERLRRENLRLKRQLEKRDMVVELLKKVKEFEGM